MIADDPGGLHVITRVFKHGGMRRVSVRMMKCEKRLVWPLLLLTIKGKGVWAAAGSGKSHESRFSPSATQRNTGQPIL